MNNSGLLPITVSGVNTRSSATVSRSNLRSWERRITGKKILGCILLLFLISFLGLILMSTLDAPLSSSDGNKKKNSRINQSILD
jgi:hypothetical protein